ncbi:hypothetical protein ACTXGK_10945 [Psychrobacter sp. T6-5]|jgi:hypothetical protein|uniref:hypothetical protein n=1 Tax=Psychrobacter sp. T6-5 TaxID=3457451 RepID=UPI0030DB9245
MKYHFNEAKLKSVPCAALYPSDTEGFQSAVIACFIISDGWNEQALLELKEKAEADILVGLQTDNNEYERLDIVEGIIRCQPNEVNDVVELLDVRSASTIIGIDVIDVINLFEVGSSFQFVQASSTGEHEFDMIKIATHKLIDLLAKAHDTKGIFVGMQSPQSLPLESMAYVTEAVEELLSGDDTFIYYSSNSTDEPKFFRLNGIYAEEKQSHT